jgi:hypothetical protein
MTANELIAALQALPAPDRKLPVCSYELSMLVELEPPRIGYRKRSDHQEAAVSRRHERVIVL